MVNDLEKYAEAGREAAEARNKGDNSRALQMIAYKGAMQRAEKLEDWETATEAFDAAYNATINEEGKSDGN